MSEDKNQLGKISLAKKLVAPGEAEGPEEEARVPSTGSFRGLRTADALRALSTQLGVPGIDLERIGLSTDHLILPEEYARLRSVLPFFADQERLFVAVGSPDAAVLREVEEMTGLVPRCYVALPLPLLRAIDDAYGAKRGNKEFYFGRHARTAENRSTLLSLATILPRAHGKDAAVVTDPSTQEAGARDRLSVNEVGRLPEEISTLTKLPGGAIGVKCIVFADALDSERTACADALSSLGHVVCAVSTGHEFLQTLRTVDPLLVVLETSLPGIHGLELLRRMKASARFASVPIVLVGPPLSQPRTFGADAYLGRPLSPAEVVKSLERFLTSASQAQEDQEAAAGDKALGKEEVERLLIDGSRAFKAGRVDEAIAAMFKGAALDPLAFRVRYQLALMLGKVGRTHEAITELERATELLPGYFPALKNLAILYEKGGFRANAQGAWERAMEVAPDAATREKVARQLAKLWG